MKVLIGTFLDNLKHLFLLAKHLLTFDFEMTTNLIIIIEQDRLTIRKSTLTT